MLRIKSKRGVALIFLMELLLLVGFITLLFAAASAIMSNDGKYRDLDAKNIALFLDRIPSIEGNFYYNLSLQKDASVKITVEGISLGESNSAVYKHTAEYYSNLKIDGLDVSTPILFKNVSNIYFYKVQDQIYILEKPDSILQANLKQIPLDEKPAFSVNPFYVGPNVNPLVRSTNPTLDILITDEQKSSPVSVELKYSPLARDHAVSLHNEIIDFLSKDGSAVTMSIVPQELILINKSFSQSVSSDLMLTVTIYEVPERFKIHSALERWSR